MRIFVVMKNDGLVRAYADRRKAYNERQRLYEEWRAAYPNNQPPRFWVEDVYYEEN